MNKSVKSVSVFIRNQHMYNGYRINKVEFTVQFFGYTVNYLKMICKTVVGRDIIERHGIRQENLFEAVIDFLCSNIGSYVSANKIADTLKSNGYSKVTPDTIGNYLEFVCDAYLFYKAQRYDI